MAFKGANVVKLLRQKGIKAKDFFAYVYPERSGNASYSDIAKNDNPKAETIERIADLLQCPIEELFDRETRYATNNVTGDNNSVGNVSINSNPEVLNATIQQLHNIIARQDKTIDEQNHRIDQLIELARINSVSTRENGSDSRQT